MHEYPEKDEEIEAFEKRRKRSLILTGIAAVSLVAGVSAVAAYACGKWEETRKEIITAVGQENEKNAEEAARKEAERRSSIEQIVSEIRTPEEAYIRISTDIVFVPGNDTKLYGTDTWNSMLNTYAIKKGDCEDGAIAFAAMLSDNPEYEVNLVYLKRNPLVSLPNHMLALYQERQLGTWGYVSFNESEDEPAVMENPLYGSIDSTVNAYSDESFVSYQIVDFMAEDLKFGVDITRKFDSSAAIQLR